MKKLLLLFCVFHTLSSTAQKVHFQSGTYLLSSGIEALGQQSESEIASGTAYRILAFSRVLLPGELRSLEEKNIRMVGYLPTHAYLVEMPSAQESLDAVPLLLRLPLVGTSLLTPEMKLSTMLSSGRVADYVERKGVWDVLALCYDVQQTENTAHALSLMGAEILDVNKEEGSISFGIAPAFLRAAAALPAIGFLQQREAPEVPENTIGRRNHRISAIQTQYAGGRKYDGTGVVVGHGDDGDIGPHIDYQGRILANFSGASIGDHGDHVAGIILGAGNLQPKGQGNAPGASLVYYNYPGNLQQVDAHYSTYAVRITTSSYSDGCNAGYTNNTLTVDQDIRQNPLLMHVFSAGNNGTANCNYGAGSGWGNITGGHKQGKNVIAVANLAGNDVIASSSSRGPAHDGRIKPDVSALGTNVYSTTNPNSYTTKTGTSMSCPGVSGVLASLNHAYKSTHNGNEPAGGLMKALLMNGADDLGNAGPDFQYGYGRVNALRTTQSIENNWFFVDSVSQGQTDSVTISVPVGTAEVRVLLYWTDTEALANAGRALVNNLNGHLKKPGQSWLPWVLNPSKNVTALNSLAVRTIDTLNNAEQVTLLAPTPGDYRFVVHGASIPSGSQKYWIVYQLVSDGVEITYPAGGEAFVPGTTESIRWDASPGTTPFALEISTNGGVSWFSAGTAPASARSANLSLPTTVNDNLLLRITRGTQSDVVNAPLKTIGIPSGLAVSYACPDTLKLTWNAIAGASGYVVYRLGLKYMDSLVSVPTTYAKLAIPSTQSHWFAIAAVTPAGKVGPRSNAFQKMPGLQGCVLAQDIHLVASISPVSTVIPDCQASSTMPVQFTWHNSGTDTLSNLLFSYRLNGGAIQNGTAAGPFASGSLQNFTFNSTLNVSTAGSYSLKIWSNLASDQNKFNDTLTVLFSVVASGAVATLPYIQNFDSFTLCASTNNCAATVCPLGGGLTNAPNGSIDDIDWRTFSGATPTASTGPNADHTTGMDNYVYLEASACFNNTAHLLLPCVNLTSSTLPELSVWLSMDGATIGTIHVDVQANGVWHNDIVTPKSGPQGSNWFQWKISLFSFVGKNIVVRFRANTGATGFSDIAMDDISIQEVTSKPVAHFTATPAQACIWQSVVLADQSSNGSTSRKWRIFPTTFSYVGGTDSTSVQAQVLFSATGTYSVTLFATNAYGTDTLVTNNAVTVGNGLTLPLAQDFNSSWVPALWSVLNPDGATTWDRVTVANRTGGTSYAVRMDNYNYNLPPAEDYLVTPTLEINSLPGKLYFDVAYAPYSASYPDALRIDYSTDCGVTWSPTGYYKDGTTLPTTAATTSIFTPTLGSQWRVDTVNFAFTGSSVKFRFASINGFGNNLYLDNIHFTLNSMPAAVAMIQSSLLTACVQQSIVFQQPGPITSTSYAWNFGANAFPTSALGAGPHTVVFQSVGSHKVKLTATNANGSDRDSLFIGVGPTVVAGYTYSSPAIQSIQFTDLSGNQPSLWDWNFGDGTHSTLSSPLKVYTSGGNYTVQLKSWNGCSVDSVSSSIYVSGIGLQEQPWSLSLYPNPTRDKVSWSIQGANLERIEFVDLTGRVMVRIQNPTLQEYSVSDWAAGLYQVRVQTSRGMATMPLVIQP